MAQKTIKITRKIGKRAVKTQAHHQAHHALNPRQAQILAAIVREYSLRPEPVASEEINAKYKLGVSSATVRNEMIALERAGYIQQPHTSAGRVPTDLGYRYFVNELMQSFELSLKEQSILRQQLLQLQAQSQELGRNIARLLSQKTEQAAFALLPDEASSAGLAHILQNSNLAKKETVEAVQFFENIDAHAGQMLQKFFKEKPAALIGGKEHHLAPLQNYSLIVSKVALPSGEKGMIGILGPKAMRYDKNLKLVEYVAKFLSGTAMLFLIIKI